LGKHHATLREETVRISVPEEISHIRDETVYEKNAVFLDVTL
jgi:hypothetical protein